jgi:hypothetical protein
MAPSTIYVTVNDISHDIELELGSACVRDVAEALGVQSISRPGGLLLAPSMPLKSVLPRPNNATKRLRLQAEMAGALQEQRAGCKVRQVAPWAHVTVLLQGCKRALPERQSTSRGRWADCKSGSAAT